jgi:23S rRNA (guanine2445-N2)-methyltransferase / 23S rRNA (guanine2069-N7)-methyltransferase
MQKLTSDQPIEWLAACPKGLEQLLADEIRQLGGEVVKETHLGVRWIGTLKQGYEFCLWTRLANRLLLPLEERQVDNVDQMYDVAHSIPWHELFPVDSTLRVDFHGKADFVNNTQFGAQKIKDAIVDRFRSEMGGRPSVSKDADARIEVQLRKGRLAISYNFGGDSLHKRGYRLMPGKAPLKENLAAGILVRAGWPELAKEGKNLVDPMCGSGTLIIEALLMAADVAPGLNRKKNGFDILLDHDRSIWQELITDARQRRTDGFANLKNQFFGWDLSEDQIRAARSNLSRAGASEAVLEDNIQLHHKSFSELWLRNSQINKGGLLICNPPYGERLSELPQLAPLYQELNEVTRKLIPKWKLAMITGNTDLARAIRRPLFKKYSLFNGKIPSTLFIFDACDERSEQAPKTAIHGPVEAFANRLKKNLKNLRKWAKREGVSCYRIYDADLPEYAVAIDQYEDWLHVQEYVPPKSIDPDKAERRLLDVLAVLPEVTGVPVEQVVLKRRERQSGKKQYERQTQKAEPVDNRMAVKEGNVQLWVNLRDYLDTGLFLDHRPTRLNIAKQAKGQRFLNLFCYTATASVHAAEAGAKSTTSVDLSKTYLAWAEDNFTLNGLLDETGDGFNPWQQKETAKHRFIAADCREWLKSIQDETEEQKYDLIFMDPPTFSNSKRMEGVLDIQRDHADLITLAMARLKKHGKLIFSNNLRKFEMDTDALKQFAISNVSSKSVPEDFKRRANIHHCYEVTHKKKK